MNPYEVLGVSVGVTESELRKAFLELAKKFHPDTAVDEADRREKEERFKEITYAYNVLKKSISVSFSANRAEQNSKNNDIKWDVNFLKKKAHSYINKGDYNSAIDVLRIIDNPDYEINMLLGIAHFRKKQLHLASEFFKRAHEQNPWKSEALAYLGEVYRSIGLNKSAAKYYRDALSIDSNNKMALKGLEKLEKSGFSIKSFFKKG